MSRRGLSRLPSLTAARTATPGVRAAVKRPAWRLRPSVPIVQVQAALVHGFGDVFGGDGENRSDPRWCVRPLSVRRQVPRSLFDAWEEAEQIASVA